VCRVLQKYQEASVVKARWWVGTPDLKGAASMLAKAGTGEVSHSSTFSLARGWGARGAVFAVNLAGPAPRW
jgi:hypothetical protein